MAPPKATAWPESVYEDPDVLTLDVSGKYILCRVCAESYAMRKGKKPKPVAMNACFRTRAWETHKVRTRAHRLQQNTTVAANARRESPPLLPLPSSAVSTPTSERSSVSFERLPPMELQQSAERETYVLPSLQQVIATPQINRERLTAPYLRLRREYEAVSPLVFPLSRYPSRSMNNTEERWPKNFRRTRGGTDFGAEPRRAAAPTPRTDPVQDRRSNYQALGSHEWRYASTEPEPREESPAEGRWSELRFV